MSSKHKIMSRLLAVLAPAILSFSTVALAQPSGPGPGGPGNMTGPGPGGPGNMMNTGWDWGMGWGMGGFGGIGLLLVVLLIVGFGFVLVRRRNS